MINRVGITTIFVTHDQEEAVEVADEIMIINQGVLEQKGLRIEIYKNPQTPFVAGFIGESNRVDSIDGLKGFSDGIEQAQAIIRPEFIEIGTEKEIPFLSAAEYGVVKNVFFRGTNWQIEVDVGPYKLFGYRSLEQEILNPGTNVYVLIHRLYKYNNQGTQMQENKLKFDPLPVHI